MVRRRVEMVGARPSAVDGLALVRLKGRRER